MVNLEQLLMGSATTLIVLVTLLIVALLVMILRIMYKIYSVVQGFEKIIIDLENILSKKLDVSLKSKIITGVADTIIDVFRK